MIGMTRSINKYVYVSYAIQAINVIVNFVYSLIIVHLLGASGFGEYSIFNNSLAFSILLLGFNLPSVIVFFIANKRIDPGKLLFSSLLFALAASVFLVFLLFKSDSLGFAIHIFPNGTNKPGWIFLFVAQFFLLQTNQVFTAFLNTRRIFIPVSAAVLVMNILLILFWALFSFHLFSIDLPLFDLIWWVSIVFNTCIVIYYAWLTFSHTPERLRLKFIGWAELRLLAGFAVVVYLCNSIQFLNYKMDVWFVNYYGEKMDTGMYSLALSLSQLIWILPNAVSGVLLNYYQVHQRGESIKLAMHYGSLSIYLSLFTALILSVVYYFALPVIYGAQFSKVFILCAVLFIGTIPFSLTIIIANLNSGIGFIRINLYATLFTFVLGFILDYLLIPVYGITGAAVAKITIYIAGLIFQVLVGGHLYKLPWKDLFKFPDFRMIFKKEFINY